VEASGEASGEGEFQGFLASSNGASNPSTPSIPRTLVARGSSPNRATQPESAESPGSAVAVASTLSTLRFRVCYRVSNIQVSYLDSNGRLRSQAFLSSLEQE